jgi:hypothetical protein
MGMPANVVHGNGADYLSWFSTFQTYDGPIPDSNSVYPPLDPTIYNACFGVILTGYVEVPFPVINLTGIATIPDSFYHKFQARRHNAACTAQAACC